VTDEEDRGDPAIAISTIPLVYVQTTDRSNAKVLVLWMDVLVFKILGY